MKRLALIPLLAVALFGCDSNPTNEPSAEDINKAVDAKYKAIDNDPSMTAEQKAEMKKHIAGPATAPPSQPSR
jgi:hypothetical protein